MKKFAILSIIAATILLGSCKDETEKPKVIYEDAKNSVKAIVKDTTQIKIADLPIYMEGSNYLIHPIGDYRIYDKSSKWSYGATSGEGSFTISNTSEFEITGFLSDLKFQAIGSDSLKSLTDKPILIQRATYLKAKFDNSKQKFMIYVLSDSDTNKDGKLDSNDIQTLYISQLTGERFTKLSVAFQELLDWNFIEVQNRLYFRTIEDINKNGEFNKSDKIHYQFVNLSNNDWKVESYEPI
ncbi:hypothetical protein [Flavobacterium sp.]|uniref:hypothetical protein n=1 Tax=Flavobacterium sp. TaxID=239 RepID=UPI00286B8F89|nr:hypothetical protein [Flavobacterium sp.]